MAYFLKSGNTFSVTSKEAMDLHEMLPPGNYLVKERPMEGPLYLESIDAFEIKGKRYGDLDSNTERILSTFMDRPSATGVMLAGEKGSGKSLLAKNLAIQAAVRHNIPCIVINAPWCGDKFNSFLQTIDQPCMVLFDEFEKVYDEDDQEQALTLLDGVFPSKKLFVITCNDKWRINGNMRNRPGRLFYMLDYKGLDANFIAEYCHDNLNTSLLKHIDRLCQIASLFDQFNFDMLKATVEEMNRYNESPEASLRMLNVKPEFSGNTTYSVKIIIDGEEVKDDYIDSDSKEWEGNPLHNEVGVNVKIKGKATGSNSERPVRATSGRVNSSIATNDPPEYSWKWIKFETGDLIKIDSSAGKFVFVNKDGVTLVLVKITAKFYSYLDAF